jgi:hypothetical protein
MCCRSPPLALDQMLECEVETRAVNRLSGTAVEHDVTVRSNWNG